MISPLFVLLAANMNAVCHIHGSSMKSAVTNCYNAGKTLYGPVQTIVMFSPIRIYVTGATKVLTDGTSRAGSVAVEARRRRGRARTPAADSPAGNELEPQTSFIFRLL